MSKHTPGPWHAEKRKCHFHIIAADLTRVTTVLGVDGPIRKAVGDARLIAAAPEMLEALKEIHLAMSRQDHAGLIGVIRVWAGEAIAKAEGE